MLIIDLRHEVEVLQQLLSTHPSKARSAQLIREWRARGESQEKTRKNRDRLFAGVQSAKKANVAVGCRVKFESR